MNPSKNSSNPHHHQVETPKVGNAREESSPELYPERNREAVVNISDSVQDTDGKANVVAPGNETPVRLVASPLHKLCQVLAFFSLAVYFLGNIMNRSPSPTSKETPKAGNAGEESSPELNADPNEELIETISKILEGIHGTANVFVVNGTSRKRVVRRHNDRNSPPHDLCQIALGFFAQLAAVFVGNVFNKSPSPCCCSSSHSHPLDHNWTPVTVAVISLVGFVITLFSMSTAKMRATIYSSATAKFGVAAVASVVIISVGMILPFHTKGNIAATVVSCIPALVAIARA